MFRQEKLIRYRNTVLSFIEQHDYSICLLFTKQDSGIPVHFLLVTLAQHY